MPVFWKSMRDNRRGWIGWTVALAAIAAMYASFYPSINNPAMADALNSFPQSVKDALHMEDYTKPENYFAVSVFGLLVPILVAVFAISAGVKAIAGDEEAGTLDLVLAHHEEEAGGEGAHLRLRGEGDGEEQLAPGRHEPARKAGLLTDGRRAWIPAGEDDPDPTAGSRAEDVHRVGSAIRPSGRGERARPDGDSGPPRGVEEEYEGIVNADRV